MLEARPMLLLLAVRELASCLSNVKISHSPGARSQPFDPPRAACSVPRQLNCGGKHTPSQCEHRYILIRKPFIEQGNPSAWGLSPRLRITYPPVPPRNPLVKACRQAFQEGEESRSYSILRVFYIVLRYLALAG